MDDVISRQATIEAINKIMPIDIECDGKLLDLVDVRYVLDNMPTAEPKRIRGQWSIKGQAIDTVRGYWAKCSACGHSVFGGGNYCSYCGSYNKGEVTT